LEPGRELWIWTGGFCDRATARDYNEETAPGQPPFRLYTWPKLARFPVFWIGLLFLAYIAIQGFNPAWLYATDGQGWWMTAAQPIAWLPSSVDVPFAAVDLGER